MLRPLRLLLGLDSQGMGCGGGPADSFSIGDYGDPATCSGRGECHNGTCLCEIRFAGEECSGPNVPYHAGIGGVFFFVALVSVIQLLICIVSEYQRLKAPSVLRACRITTQKLLYFVVFLASLIRGAYFTSPEGVNSSWASSLLSAYYPLLMSGSSLIVCFWAEIFHLRDIRWEKPQFLSKSFLGFLTFNLVSYSLLVAEVVTTQLAETSLEDKSFYVHVFNGCYALLLFIVVIFFLIYGVEVFFKVRGGFIPDAVSSIASSSHSSSAPTPSTSSAPVDTPVADQTGPEWQRAVNTSQLHQSRFGLLSQAFMLIIIVGFLCSETLGEFWKKKVPVNSRNWHDIVFRLVEIGVALWFPCVLWNCMAPEQLWILNPRRLLSRQVDLPPALNDKVDEKTKDVSEEGESFLAIKDCWICYDPDKAEPLIQPCRCTGDVSSVHHDCLRRWLVESSSNADSLKCKVCGYPYEVHTSSKLDWERGFTAQHWMSTCAFVTLMCLAGAGAWITVQLFEDPIIRVLSAGSALIVIYVCVRFLGLNTVSAYQRAKVSSLSINNSKDSSSEETKALTTISETVSVEIPTKQGLTSA